MAGNNLTKVADANPDYLVRGQFENTLTDRLKEGPTRVWFDKRDGTQREMLCTLHSDYITPYEKKTDRERPPRPDVLSVWDVQADGWRSIPLDRVLGFTTRANI